MPVAIRQATVNILATSNWTHLCSYHLVRGDLARCIVRGDVAWWIVRGDLARCIVRGDLARWIVRGDLAW